MLEGQTCNQLLPAAKKAQTSLASAALLSVSVEFLTMMDSALSLSDFCALWLCRVRAGKGCEAHLRVWRGRAVCWHCE